MRSWLKDVLKNLCCNYGWSYGVLWRIDIRNSMLLTFEDAHYDKKTELFIQQMLLQIHENLEFAHQHFSGIKTIAVISLGSQGVLQLGSYQKMQESTEFVDLVRALFQQLQSSNACNLPGNATSHSTMKSTTSDGNLAALFSPKFFSQSNNNLESWSNRDNPQYNIHNSIALNPCISNLTNDSSFIATANENTQISLNAIPAERGFQEDSDFTLYTTVGLFETLASTGLLGNNIPPVQSSGDFLDVRNYMPSKATDQQGFHQEDSSKTVLQSNAQSDIFEWINSLVEQNDLENNLENDISEYLSSVLEQRNVSPTMSEDNTLPQAVDASASSAMTGGEAIDSLSLSQVTPVQSSITNFMDSLSAICNENDNFLDVSTRSPTYEDDIFNNLGLDFSNMEQESSVEDIAATLGSESASLIACIPQCMEKESHVENIVTTFGSHTGLSACIPQYTSETDIFLMNCQQKEIETDWEELLENFDITVDSVNKPNNVDQFIGTVTPMGSTSADSNQVQLGNSTSLMRYMEERLTEFQHQRALTEGIQNQPRPKPQLSSWTDSSDIMKRETTATTQPRKDQVPAKASKKRVKPGEGTRPRPKDRQLIQDRVKELRELVPEGAKCSIDSLFENTIKYMHFLQGVTKHADKLKYESEQKNCEKGAVILRDNSSHGDTWAFEVKGQTTVCSDDIIPISEMLVEMLCEDRGLFLEIVDIVRGFGFTILKGSMETQENKMWACFIVEANRNLNAKSFCTLADILRQKVSSGDGSNHKLNCEANSSISLFKNYQSAMNFPTCFDYKLQ
ncbi:Transcription factor MYC/MYB N-terminal [Dillenia turbinata]|uniref:Transcription factor MYC/MYB N-terminal n=1 Tax=Dillenia turbinata TaxID=194707 RepID=A0AAN8V9G3_9MAGN